MIHLRKVEPSDLPFLYQWENDAQVWCTSDTHNPLSQQDLRTYIESTTGDIYRDGQLRLMIMEDESTIGCVDLYALDARNRKVAVGIYIDLLHRQKGYATQALTLIENYAFDYLQLRLLYAFVGCNNLPSQQLFTRLQYTPSSRLPQWTLEGDAQIWVKQNSLKY